MITYEEEIKEANKEESELLDSLCENDLITDEELLLAKGDL